MSTSDVDVGGVQGHRENWHATMYRYRFLCWEYSKGRPTPASAPLAEKRRPRQSNPHTNP